MIETRDYQTVAIGEARAHVAAGFRAPLIVAPTGAGKTTMGAVIVSGHITRRPSVARVAWLAHRRELIEQGADRLRSFGLRVGHGGLDAGAPVQVSSVQTILSRGEAPEASLVVLDEAHHYVSDEWKAIARAYLSQGSILVGLTATPERDDGRPLREVFDSLVVSAQIGDLIREGYLVPCEIMKPTRRVPKGKLAEMPHAAYKRVCMGAAAVVFAPHVKAAHDYAEGFKTIGVPVGVIHGDMNDNDRADTLRKYKNGEIRVLCNVMVLTEGWDAPHTEVIIMARRVGSCSLYLQMGGRGLRPHPGKSRCLMLDLVGVSQVHGPLEEERIYSLDGRPRRKGESASQRYCATCGAPLAPAAVCEMCGPNGGELNTPMGAGIALEKFSWIRSQPKEQRAVYLARWYCQAQAKGHRAESAHYRFKGTFNEWPTVAIQKEAKGIVAEMVKRDAERMAS